MMTAEPAPPGSPIVALAMPYLGNIHPGAAQGFFLHPTAGPRNGGCRVAHIANGSSALTKNFNALWCDALNLRKQLGITHFAMLHADIQPEQHWLDKLLAELTRLDADVVSAVVPIKSGHGLTSTAIGTKDDIYHNRRLTMTEAHQLPKTFNRSDVAKVFGMDGPLLINTGCWVADLRRHWCDHTIDDKLPWCFDIRNEIRYDPKTGEFQEKFFSEDWLFGRYLDSIGAKVYATTAVKANHMGERAFANDHSWGAWTTDEVFFRGEPPGETPTQAHGFRFPNEVDGWLTRVEGEGLYELARGKRVLEIGSYCGRSTICLAQSAEHVHCVDPHDGRATTKPRDTLGEFKANVNRYGLTDKVTVTTQLLTPYLGRDERAEYDLVFIDGDHSEEAVRKDVVCAMARLRPGGRLAFHDYRTRPGEHDGRWDQDVTKVVDELVRGGAVLEARYGTVAVVNPWTCPATIPGGA